MPRGKKISDHIKRQMYKMYKNGISYKEIARKYGYSYNTVWKSISKMISEQNESERIVITDGIHELKYNTVEGYVGYFFPKSGKYEKKSFKSRSDKAAIDAFRDWIGTLTVNSVVDILPQEPSKPDTTPTGKELGPISEAIVIVDEPEKNDATNVYVIFTSRPKIDAYGYFLSMDAALAELEKLNSVAKLLGHGNEAFDILEVPMKEPGILHTT